MGGYGRGTSPSFQHVVETLKAIKVSFALLS